MSAGSFVLTRYEADSGTVYPIRVQPETLSANIGGANAAPAGTADADVFARTGGGNRRYALKARSVSVKFTGALPTGYAAGQTLRIPILTPALWNSITVGDTGTYLGSDIQVVGRLREAGR